MKTRLYFVGCMMVLFIGVLSISPIFAQSLSAPWLDSPNMNPLVSTNPVVLNWHSTGTLPVGATFHLQVSPSSYPAAFSPVILDVSGLTGNQYSSFVAEGSTTYQWRVRVETVSDSSNWSLGWFSTVSSLTPTPPSSGDTVLATAGSNGSIFPSGTVVVTPGANQQFIMTPNAGYNADTVKVDGVKVDSTTSYTFINVNANHTISVHFALNPVGTYTITASAGIGGNITPSGSVLVSSGNNQAFSITTNAGYGVDSVIVDGVEVDSTYHYTFNHVTASHSIRVTFVHNNTYYVNASNPSLGDGSFANPFKYLQDAVDSSVASGLSGNTISVAAGSYTVGHDQYGILVNDNDLTITGTTGASVLKFTVVSNNVNISNFTATNTTVAGAGLIASGVSNLAVSGFTATGNNAWGAYLININSLNISNSHFDGNNTANSSLYGGILLQGCQNVSVNNVTASNNKYDGIDFTSGSNGSYTNVTANNNTNDGFNFKLVSNGSYNNLTARLNARYGLNLNESSNNAFVGGNFSRNSDGMHIHPHWDADVDVQDSISGLSFTGSVVADSNSNRGIVLMTDIGGVNGAADTTYIASPNFNGSFELKGNTVGGIFVYGKVVNPVFRGFNFYGNGTNYGVLITGKGNVTTTTRLADPSGVRLTNNIFRGFSYAAPGADSMRFAISLKDFAGNTSGNRVEATNNVFFGASLIADVNNAIFDSLDYATTDSLGYVNITGWNNGTPTITINDETTLTGSSFTVPVDLNIYTPQTYNTLEGKIYYDSAKVKFNFFDGGTGTLFNSNGWYFTYIDTVASDSTRVIHFTAAKIGGTSITTSGTLFNLGFKVVDVTADTSLVWGNLSQWAANNVFSALSIQNGVVIYTVPVLPSTVRGDANMDYVVTAADAFTILNHLQTPFLTGQAAINADANLDGQITTTDVHYIEYYVLNGSWPVYLPNRIATGLLQIPSVTFKEQGTVDIPISVASANNINSLEVMVQYDPTVINYQSFSQQMLDKGYVVSAREMAPGTAMFVFASGKTLFGEFDPGKIILRFVNGSPAVGSVGKTFYKINDTQFKEGPSFTFSVTGIEENNLTNKNIPDKFEISQNYPNPFNPSTMINYSLPIASHVTIKIFDLLGQEIKTLVNEERSAGVYSVQWNGDNNMGVKVSSGTYIYRVAAGSFVQTKKMVLLK